jgi:hypothetical protein
VQRPEQLRLFLSRDADAAVTHLEPEADLSVILLAGGDTHPYPTPVRELEPVADEVDEHLPEPGRVALDDGRRVFVKIEGEVEPTLDGLGGKQGSYLLNHLGN